MCPLALAVSALALPNRAEISKTFGNIPLYFEENRGQAEIRARFITRAPHYSAIITDQGAELSFGAGRSFAKITMSVAGAQHTAQLKAEAPLPGYSNYYFGNDRTQWTAGIRHYQQVRAGGVRPGIDLVYHGDQKQLEFDFEVAPGADVRDLRLQLKGAKSLSIDADGNLLIHTVAGDLTQHKPVAWQLSETTKRPVEATYAIQSNGEVAIRLGAYDPHVPLIVDPVLSYSTYLSGSQNDVVTSIAVDASGYAYIAGYTTSPDFPATTGQFKGYTDAFVTKLNPAGTAIVYSTIFGGSADDQAFAIALDGAGNAYVTGITLSSDFPVAGTGLPAAVAGDAMLTKIGPTGALIYSRTFGGGAPTTGKGIAVDNSGQAYIAGSTHSPNLPVTAGAFQNRNSSGFVAKFSPNAAISYATYLGGTRSDTPEAIALDASGNAYIAGSTLSSDFPVTAFALQTTLRGSSDAFIAKLNPSGTALVYSTFLGGANSDSGFAVAVDSLGNAYIGGSTGSQDFPTTPGAFSTVGSTNPTFDAFVAKLNPAGTALVYSTFLSGAADDAVTGLAIDAAQNAFVTGTTASMMFPTTPGALENQNVNPFGLVQQAFFALLNPAGSTLTYSTYLGITSTPPRIAVDSAGGAYIAGSTSNSDFPATPSAYQIVPARKGASNNTSGYVARIDTSSPVACHPLFSSYPGNIAGHGGAGSFSFTLAQGCPWQITTDSSWIALSGPTAGPEAQRLTSPSHSTTTRRLFWGLARERSA